ncbi:cation transporter [Halalkalibacter sp. AB-rgal2]|uniref:cation transporter n=1 Tax=Halalkalibacter sp. AB-rgal2 TaxID=3242695 RepID=UPI00359CE5F1
MQQKRVEQQTLIVSILINISLGASAFGVYAQTGIPAVFLDAYFSLIVAISSIVAILISRYSVRSSEVYPYGRFVLEPLYAVFKSLVTISLLLIALSQSAAILYTYWRTGDVDKLNVTPVIPYIMLMIVLSFGLSIFARYQNRKIGEASTILAADSRTAFVDGLMATGVATGVGLFLLVDERGPLSFVLYIGDAIISLILVMFAWLTPVSLLKNSFIELTSGITPRVQWREQIQPIVEQNLPDICLLTTCQVRKVGMFIHISVMLEFTEPVVPIAALRTSKHNIEQLLSINYPHYQLDFIVSGD